MANSPIEQMTLREMFSGAERVTQKLIEHLDQGFLPKSRQLVRLVQPTESETYSRDVEDVTVRNHTARVVENEVFTEQLSEELGEYCRAIESAVSRIVNEG